ncbi:hypothetical protein IT570_00705 [Candidatus Sumerlaeota bacterium]|nr:hypothetical protein [Candidatus Sumerlaeota bacterium]
MSAPIAARDALEKARQLGDDERAVIDLLLAEEAAHRNVKQGRFAVNLAVVGRQLHWGQRRILAALNRIREFLA